MVGRERKRPQEGYGSCTTEAELAKTHCDIIFDQNSRKLKIESNYLPLASPTLVYLSVLTVKPPSVLGRSSI